MDPPSLQQILECELTKDKKEILLARLYADYVPESTVNESQTAADTSASTAEILALTP